MKKCFSINNSVEVVWGDEWRDLHNSYEFIGLFILSSRELVLEFEPDKDFGRGLECVRLVFEGVDFLELSQGFGCKRISGLDEMGYVPVDQKFDESLTSEEQACDGDHMYFRFVGLHYVRVHSASVRLELAGVTVA